MVLRSFFAFDNANLVVTSSSNGSLVGNPIINNGNTPNGTVFVYSSGGGATVTLDDDERRNVFDDDEEEDHVIVDGGGLVANGTEVEAESRIFVRALDGNGDPTGPTIRLTVFSQDGNFSDIWGFGTNRELQDGVSYVKVSGSNTGDTRYNSFITCFGPGSAIRTASGDMPVEDITVGQMVWTRDNGDMPVTWIGSTTVPGTGAFAPVVFTPGSIGNDAELVVSQEHRMFFASAQAEMLFGQSDVLIAAKHLCGLPGVNIIEREEIRYTHLMFDSHQIIQSNGVLTESFFLSENALSGVTRDQRRELLSLFPSLDEGVERFGRSAALTLRKADAALLRPHLP
ncbi:MULTISPECIES: Hint domain-containing protein [unclassified Roseovarius]|uniref:Hint domain-containing protein n=1 Tax=unclassified Roseovarius TaxID=2614913 RepID=UPI00273E4D9A|nr:MULTISPECIES: Hint domain-containing protein [unclassified Roseovarius]